MAGLPASSIPRLAPTSSSSTSAKAAASRCGLVVGQRVVASGCKRGIVRYIGATKFATGIWAGLELDQPLGKNDGSVQDVRYFTCQPKYGLFAPCDKVVPEADFDEEAERKKLPYRSNIASSLRHLHNGSLRGSQESLNSLSSFQSSASRRRTNQLIVPPSPKNPVAEALQVSMKEKDYHLEQLMKERDIEREELSRMTSLYGKASEESANLKALLHQEVSSLKAELEAALQAKQVAEEESKKWLQSFEAEKQRNDDIQFKLEEDLCALADSKSSALEKELETATLKCEKMKAESDNARQRFEALLAERDRQFALAKSQIESLENRFKEKVEESEFVLASGASSEEVMQLNARLEQLEKELEAAASREADLKKNLAETVQGCSAQVAQLQAQLDAALSSQKAEESEKKEQESAGAALIKQKDDQIAELTKKLASMAEATNASERRLEESRSAAGALETRNSILEKQVQELTAQLASQKAELDAAAASKSAEESAKKEKELTSAALIKEDSELAELTNQLASMNVTAATSQKALEESRVKVSALDAQNDDLRKQMQELAAQVALQKAKMDAAAASKSAEDAARKEQEAAGAAMMQQKDDQIAELTKRLTSMEEKTNASKRELEDARSTTSALATQNSGLEKQLQELRARLELQKTELDAAAASKSAEDSAKKEQDLATAALMKQKDDQMAEMLKRLASMEEAAAASQKELQESRSTASALEARSSSLEKQLQELSAQLELKKAEKDAATAMKAADDAARNEQEAVNAMLIRQKEDQIDELTKRLTTTEEAMAASQKELQESRSTANALKTRSSDLEKRVKELSDQVDLQKAQLETATASKSAEDSAKSAQESAIAALVKQKDDQIAELKKHVTLTEEAITTSRKDLEESRSKTTNLETRNSGLEKRVQELTAQLELHKAQLDAAIASKFAEESARKEEESTSATVIKQKDDQIAELSRLWTSAEEARLVLQNQLEESRSMAGTLEARSSDLEKELQQLSARLQLQQTQLESAVASKSAEESARKEQESASAALMKQKEDEIAELMRRLASTEEMTTASKRQLQESLSAASTLQNQCGGLQKQVQELTTQLELQKTQLDAVAASNSADESAKKEQEFANAALIKQKDDQIAELTKRLTSMEQAASISQKELQESCSKASELESRSSGLEKQLQELTAELESQKAQLDDAVASKSAEDAAKKEIESICAALIRKKEDQIAELTERLTSMEEAVNALRQELKDSQSAQRQAQKENIHREVQTEAAPEKAVSGSPSEDGTIAFLNSVIAELQRKNEELMHFKKQQEDAEVFDLSDIKSLLPAQRAIIRRQYCDICEVFDKHDTADCPFDDHDKETHSHYDGQRGVSRLFCDICEGTHAVRLPGQRYSYKTLCSAIWDPDQLSAPSWHPGYKTRLSSFVSFGHIPQDDGTTKRTVIILEEAFIQQWIETDRILRLLLKFV